MFNPYQFNLFRDKLVIYDYNNQPHTEIKLTHDQLLEFLRNVINKPKHLEIEDEVEYTGTWLSGTLDEARVKYRAMIAANNAEVRDAAAAADAANNADVQADYGGKHRGHSHKRSGKRSHKRSGKRSHKRSGKRSHKRSHKRSGKSGNKRSGHKGRNSHTNKSSRRRH